MENKMAKSRKLFKKYRIYSCFLDIKIDSREVCAFSIHCVCVKFVYKDSKKMCLF